MALYDGTNGRVYSFAEKSLALGTPTSGTNYDVFAYASGGAVTLDNTSLVAWSSNTARATNILQQHGVWVKSGSTTYRYLGTIRTTATTTTEDSALNHYVFNASNRVRRPTRPPLCRPASGCPAPADFSDAFSLQRCLRHLQRTQPSSRAEYSENIDIF